MIKKLLLIFTLIPIALSANEIRRPLVSSPISVPNAYDSAGNSTSSFISATGANCPDLTLDEGTGRYSCNGSVGATDTETTVISSWVLPSGAYTGLALIVESDCTLIDPDAAGTNCEIDYSINNGSTWTGIRAGNWADHTDTIVLSPSQDLSLLKVRVFAIANGASGGGGFTQPSPASTTMDLFDIRTEGALLAPPDAAPVLLQVFPERGAVRVLWQNFATNQTSNTVKKCTGAGCTPVDYVTGLSRITIAYDDTGITARAHYRYDACAVNSAGVACSAIGDVIVVPKPMGTIISKNKHMKAHHEIANAIISHNPNGGP